GWKTSGCSRIASRAVPSSRPRARSGGTPLAGPAARVPCPASPLRMPSSHSTRSWPLQEVNMNRYGLMARQHWARWLPSRYAAIENQEAFFTDLGRQVAERIDVLALRLAGDDQPGEGYLGKAGRLGQARHQAEEIILAEMVLLSPEPGIEDQEA